MTEAKRLTTKLKWKFKRVDRSFSGENDAYYYRNNDIFNPYIIRMIITSANDSASKTSIEYVIYDTRHYSNMATIDFNFFGYSRASKPIKSLKYAKSRAKQLQTKEVT